MLIQPLLSIDDAFVGLKNVRGLFNVRDRSQHTRKRKIVSSTFSQKVHKFLCELDSELMLLNYTERS